mgnify:CR=1 FL=1
MLEPEYLEKFSEQLLALVDALGTAIIADISKKTQEPVKGKKLFSKVQPNGISDYTKELNTKCFVCERIEDTFKRYIDTIIYLYKQDESFRKKYNECQGFCTQHYGVS